MSSRLHPALRLALCVLGALLLQGVVASVFIAARRSIPLAPGVSASISPAETLVVTLFTYPALVAWLWFCRRTFDKLSLRSLGLHTARGVRLFGSGALCGGLAIGLLWAALWLLGEISVEGLSDLAFGAPALQTFATLSLWALAFVAVGFVEELCFRGYALHNLTAWLGSRAGIVLQALGFALVHVSNVYHATGHFGTDFSKAMRAIGWGAPNIFLIALFFALAYRKTGSLWFPIGFHAGWNWFLGCVFSLPVSGIPDFPSLLRVNVNNNLLTGGAFGAEASLLLVPILGALCLLASRAPDHAQAQLDLALTKTGLIPIEATPQIAAAPELEAAPDWDEQRENRFRTRFGQDVPIDAQPLHIELPPRVSTPAPSLMVDATRVDAAPEGSHADADVVFTPAPSLETAFAPVVTLEPNASEPAPRATEREVAPPEVAPELTTPEVVAPVSTPPVAPPPPKPKAPAPRW